MMRSLAGTFGVLCGAVIVVIAARYGFNSPVRERPRSSLTIPYWRSRLS